MSIVDKERIAAVATLKVLGYSFSLKTGWSLPYGAGTHCATESDALHALLIRRTDALSGCTEGSQEEDELRKITEVIEAYETKRWPNGKDVSGKV